MEAVGRTLVCDPGSSHEGRRRSGDKAEFHCGGSQRSSARHSHAAVFWLNDHCRIATFDPSSPPPYAWRSPKIKETSTNCGDLLCPGFCACKSQFNDYFDSALISTKLELEKSRGRLVDAVCRLAPFEARLATRRIRWPAKIARVVDEGQAMAVSLVLNGKRFELDVEPDASLLWAIREAAGLTGTKYGCGMALCGACTVHLNGRAIRSCVTPVRSVADKPITTIEGVSGPVAQAVLQSWERIDVAQCGYCQPGQIMSAIALLEQTPVPTDDQIDTAMSGNICRCGTYVRIRAAIHDAASIHKE